MQNGSPILTATPNARSKLVELTAVSYPRTGRCPRRDLAERSRGRCIALAGEKKVTRRSMRAMRVQRPRGGIEDATITRRGNNNLPSQRVPHSLMPLDAH